MAPRELLDLLYSRCGRVDQDRQVAARDVGGHIEPGRLHLHLALREQGRTILLCTHNLAEAEQLCDRVGVLRQRLLAVDTPDRLRSRLYGHQTVLLVRNPDARLVQALAGLDFVRQVSVGGDRDRNSAFVSNQISPQPMRRHAPLPLGR